VIDTNLLVGAMISRPGSTPRKLLAAVRDGRLKLVVSQPLIDEFLDVMSRPKLARYGITIGAVLDFLERLLAIASLVEITGAPKGCDDPDDDAVIETAEVGAADYLITGDSDLLDDRIRASLIRIGIEVITARDFLRGSFAVQFSGTNIVDHARMMVASEVASAITSSRLQQAKLTKGLESLMYDLMIAAATIKRRIALHEAKLAELKGCGESGAAVKSRRAALEADIARTAEFMRIAYESAVKATAAANSATDKIRRSLLKQNSR
jgi:putative PIN family toxin of toxin-antitoxin system